MNSHCVLAQVVDVENCKRAIYSCCPRCSGRVFYSSGRYDENYIFDRAANDKKFK